MHKVGIELSKYTGFFFVPSYTANRIEFYCSIVWLSMFCDTEHIQHHHRSIQQHFGLDSLSRWLR